jgi:hypothetical protein
MSLPKKLKINFRTYDVSKIDNLKNDRGERLWGLHKPVDSKILLDLGLRPDQEASTLMHEVLHALIDMYDLKLEDEERICECLANGLTCLFQDNPKLVKYIQEACR